MEIINIALVIIGGLVFFLGVISRRIREWNFSEPFAALIVGVLLSSAGFDILDLKLLNPRILEEAARLSLAVGVMGVALRVPSSYIIKNWRSIAAMLGIVMPFMWIMNSLLVYWLLDFNFLTALLLGAIMTPTDPILAVSIVSGQLAKDKLPERLRDLISVESGSNDGLAYPFVLLPILWMAHRPEKALNHWVINTLFWEVGAAVILGALIGYTAGHILRKAQSKKTINESSYVAYTLSLTFLTLGGIKLIGSDGILAVFVAGAFFSATSTEKERRDEKRVVEGSDRFFTIPIFTLLGLALPWQEWGKLGLEGLMLALLILILHRTPILFSIKPLVPNLKNSLDVLFTGWFGPIGVAALYYARLSMRQTGIEELWPVVSLVICMSIVLHGITATYFTKLYGKYNPEKSGNE
ncbi:hypothetical protein MSBR3_0552 [Methanosarcina barkeri 3]|uniref:Cation/H+ exchanger transmembrane domain-containing protein n=1 Tax=Methanosarcina barkeri 3 TaxID=1434107 RepID=A0A0E3WVU8_METBA|nr:cation:proton antiporter [Methanosarcina barkeri]AKB81130.1 hypothetical protein MSBR3_0552 [Methanosarcina barkeri 3]